MISHIFWLCGRMTNQVKMCTCLRNLRYVFQNCIKQTGKRRRFCKSDFLFNFQAPSPSLLSITPLLNLNSSAACSCRGVFQFPFLIASLCRVKHSYYANPAPHFESSEQSRPSFHSSIAETNIAKTIKVQQIPIYLPCFILQ